MTGTEKKRTLEEARARIVEIENLKSAMEAIQSWSEIKPARYGAGQRPGRGRHGDGVGDGAAKLADLSAKISAALCGLAEQVSLAYDIIEKVPESIDRVILTEHYICGRTWDEVAEKVAYTRDHCMYRRNAALRCFDE